MVQNKLYEEIGYRDVKSFRHILYLPILLFSNFISDYSRLIFISDKFRENLVSRGEYFFTPIVRIIFSSFMEISSSRLLYWTKEHFRVSRQLRYTVSQKSKCKYYFLNNKLEDSLMRSNTKLHNFFLENENFSEFTEKQ